MKKLLVTIAIAMMSFTAKASSDAATKPSGLKTNIHYILTEARAKALNIDLDYLKSVFALEANEVFVVMIDENAQLNLSIFEESAFNLITMDIMEP